MSSRSFRISFDPKVSMFKIEIMGFLGINWEPACTEQGGKSKPRYFGTYAEAQDAVQEMGLDKIYQDFTHGTSWEKPQQQMAASGYTIVPQILR